MSDTLWRRCRRPLSLWCWKRREFKMQCNIICTHAHTHLYWGTYLHSHLTDLLSVYLQKHKGRPGSFCEHVVCTSVRSANWPVNLSWLCNNLADLPFSEAANRNTRNAGPRQNNSHVRKTPIHKCLRAAQITSTSGRRRVGSKKGRPACKLASELQLKCKVRVHEFTGKPFYSTRYRGHGAPRVLSDCSGLGDAETWQASSSRRQLATNFLLCAVTTKVLHATTSRVSTTSWFFVSNWDSFEERTVTERPTYLEARLWSDAMRPLGEEPWKDDIIRLRKVTPVLFNWKNNANTMAASFFPPLSWRRWRLW